MPQNGETPVIISYAVTIFLGALLLFQIQLIIGKYILPWYGGTPAVWTTCMLFFQWILLAGYAGAHGLVKLRHRYQVIGQLLLLLAALVVMGHHLLGWASPLLPGQTWHPPDNLHPSGRILMLLAASVGLAGLVLATTSPLLQSWFARRWPGRSPYRLYALSNLGSLLGLISYPFLLEPFFPLEAQAGFWACGYGLFTIGFVACAMDSWKHNSQAPEPGRLPCSLPDVAPAPARRIPALQRLFWFLLPACGSMLLLATTNRMCQDVAVVPFLWILPLTLYLLTFIFSFDNPHWYSRRGYRIAYAFASTLAIFLLFRPVTPGLAVQISAYAFIVFTGCMVCHGELSKLKPPTGQLTAFYLTIAVGGAAGGLGVGLLAPLIFNGYWEFHLALWLVWALIILLLITDRESCFYQGPAGSSRRPPIWFRVSLFTFFGLFEMALLTERLDYLGKTLVSTRNFYGVLRIEEHDRDTPARYRHLLRHGDITHGIQYQDRVLRHKPLAYYGKNTGLGLALRFHPRRLEAGADGNPFRIGAVGLGIGTIAAFGRPGDRLTFYEINPEVIRLAQSTNYFSYLRDTLAEVEIVTGDARLSLAREMREGPVRQFDVLILDAFSSDAIPAHLLTKEAFEIYLHHLERPDGILAIHISNRYLDLRPVMEAAARHFDLNTWYVTSPSGPQGLFATQWLLLARREASPIPEIARVAKPAREKATSTPLWTDDYSNILGTLR